MRRLLWLLACAALSACNMAVSDHPMLDREPPSALKLKDGVWVIEDPDCTIDARLPLNQWPECADWLNIRDGKIAGAPKAKPSEMPVEVVIADGKPLIVEIPLRELGEQVARTYVYVALEPTAFDSAGTVTEAQSWGVACGPGKENDSALHDPERFPGMNDKCQPASIAVLRAAASAGPQGREKKKARFRWVRAAAN